MSPHKPDLPTAHAPYETQFSTSPLSLIIALKPDFVVENCGGIASAKKRQVRDSMVAWLEIKMMSERAFEAADQDILRIHGWEGSGMLETKVKHEKVLECSEGWADVVDGISDGLAGSEDR
jgi:hypothetical protein